MHHKDRLIRTSRLVVRYASLANRAFLLAVVASLVLSWVFAPQFAALVARTNHDPDVSAAITGVRLLMVIGIVMAIATDRILSQLAQIIASTRAGDPFISANAKRLQSIGWSLLVLQLLDIPALLLPRFFPAMGSAAPDDGISIGGWIAVLMVFVLARIFAAGTTMRDELEATV